MSIFTKPAFPKTLEAVGIAAVMIGLVQGIYRDMWGESWKNGFSNF
jgi:hypothetical protein